MKRWQPFLGLNMGWGTISGKILPKATAKLMKEQYVPRKKYADQKGVYAVDFGTFILVAKDYVYGFIVSAHLDIVEQAYTYRKNLVMYINKSDKFYEFVPERLLKYGQMNMRGGAYMVNWNVKDGKEFKL